MIREKRLLSIDPGLSSGGAVLSYTESSAPRLVDAWQVDGGVEGLLELLMNSSLYGNGFLDPTIAHTIVEKFNARNTNGFSYTTASLEPLRCEGALIALEIGDEYVQPPQQYIAGGTGKADKKKRQHRLLKELGFYVTGSMLGSKDADDARSAIAHGLGWLMRNGHKPTYELITGRTNK